MAISRNCELGRGAFWYLGKAIERSDPTEAEALIRTDLPRARRTAAVSTIPIADLVYSSDRFGFAVPGAFHRASCRRLRAYSHRHECELRWKHVAEPFKHAPREDRPKPAIDE